MLSIVQLCLLVSLIAHANWALKMSPAQWMSKYPIMKRQQSTDTCSRVTTTITTAFFGTRPNTCVCQLVSPYTPFTTITSTYTAVNSNDGTTTTTLAQQSGSVPGTVEILVPVSFVTTTSYYDGSTSGTNTIAQPSGTNPGTVLIQRPAQYVTITSYDDSFASTATTTANTYTGGTQPGTIYVNIPPSYTTTTTYSDVTAATTFTSATYTSGSVPGTIIVVSPGVYSTITTYGGSTAGGTSTVVTYTGPSGTATRAGTIVVQRPASEAPVATQSTATIVSKYTAPPISESQTLPSGSSASTTDPNDAPAPTSCDNQGLEWAEYPNVNGDWSRPGPGNVPPGYTNFTVEPYKPMTPNYEGTVSNIAGFSYVPTSQGQITIYNSATINSDYWVLNHQGYIFAPQTGVYNFTSYIADDIVLLWVGSIAYSGWTRANAALEQVYDDPPQGFVGYPGEPPVSFTVLLQQGQYYPFRIMYANAQRQAQFHIYVIAPDGDEFLGPDSAGSPYIVRHSCDEVTAPRFPAFGFQT